MKIRTVVGIGWKKQFANGGEVINLSLNLERLVELPMDKYGNIYLELSEATNPGEKSKETHTIAVDEYRKQFLTKQRTQ